MSVKRIRVRNFKSFRDLDVELRPFNVLIGANASGKTNFVRIFDFLRDITNHGLDNAISLQGGVPYLRNLNLGASEDLCIEVKSDDEIGHEIGQGEEFIGLRCREISYEFSMKFKKGRSPFVISRDRLRQVLCAVQLAKKKNEIEERKVLTEDTVFVSRSNGGIELSTGSSDSEMKNILDELFPPSVRDIGIDDPHSLLIQSSIASFPFLPMVLFRTLLSRTAVYDFDPRVLKGAHPITGKAELEPDGSNLSIVLKNILGDKEKKRKMANLVGDLLPFVSDMGVEKFADKSLLFKLREKYFEKQYLPGSMLSDGTLGIIVLIVALYFENKPLAIIEEPGRNIHPHLLSKVVEMMKDASSQKQIIVTTHNPELVKHAGIENILLVSRDEDGFTTVTHPSEKEEVRAFLQQDMSIDELYVASLLEI